MFIRALAVLGIKDKDGNGPICPGYAAEVDDNVALEMINRGVAVEVANPATQDANPAPAAMIPSVNPPAMANAPETPSEGENGPIDLEAMSFNELKALAKDMGIETGKIKSKAGMIEAITAVQMDPGDDLPDLAPQDVIDE